jgi:hypothetical protein
MASTNLQHFAGSKTNGAVALFGTMTTSTSGTVSTSSVEGFTITKTATKTGRYTITLGQNYNKLLFANAVIVGPDDTAMTDAKGTQFVIRDNDVGAGANDGTFELQFIDSDSGADAELQDAAIIMITIWVKNSSV